MYWKRAEKDFAGGPVAKTPNSGFPGLDSWSRNQIPHAATKSSYAAAKDPIHCN